MRSMDTNAWIDLDSQYTYVSTSTEKGQVGNLHSHGQLPGTLRLAP